MSYMCNCCNYTTNIKCNYDRHMKSVSHNDNYKTHTIRVKQQKNKHRDAFVCDICKKTFSRNFNLERHKNTTCDNKKLYTEDELNAAKLMIENDFLKKEVIELQKRGNEINTVTTAKLMAENDFLKKDAVERQKREEDFKKYILSAGKKSIEHNVSVKTFVCNNYPDAPPLASSNDYSKLKFDKLNKELTTSIPEDELENEAAISTIINRFKHKILHKYLGDFLINEYKKENPEDQSMWNSDASRLTYVIKLLMDDNSSAWKADPKAGTIKNNIIVPLLEYIKQFITTYTAHCVRNLQKNPETFITLMENIKSAKLIDDNITNGNLASNILKYITPHFTTQKIIKENKLKASKINFDVLPEQSINDNELNDFDEEIN